MTQDLDAHWKLHWVLVSRQGLGIWMSFMTWIRLTVHWIVSDCDLGKVSIYIVSNSALGLLYGHGILTIYENLLL